MYINNICQICEQCLYPFIQCMHAYVTFVNLVKDIISFNNIYQL